MHNNYYAFGWEIPQWKMKPMRVSADTPIVLYRVRRGQMSLQRVPASHRLPEPGYANKCPACAVVPAWGFLAASEFIQSPLQLPAMLVVM